MQLESMRKALLSNNFFHPNLLILLKIQTVIKSHSLMMGPQSWLFWYFRCALPISGIRYVIAHNIKIFQEKFGHVTPAAKGLLVLRISGITKICHKKTRSNVKFSLYLKKAGLASRNILHLKKNHPTLCRFLLLYSSSKKIPKYFDCKRPLKPLSTLPYDPGKVIKERFSL